MPKARITLVAVALLAIAALTSFVQSCAETSNAKTGATKLDAPIAKMKPAPESAEAKKARLLQEAIDQRSDELVNKGKQGGHVKIEIVFTLDGEPCQLKDSFLGEFTIEERDRELGTDNAYSGLNRWGLRDAQRIGTHFFFESTDYTEPTLNEARRYSFEAPYEFEDQRITKEGAAYELHERIVVEDLKPTMRDNLLDFGKITIELMDYSNFKSGFYTVEGRILLTDGSGLAGPDYWQYLYSGNEKEGFDELVIRPGQEGRFKLFQGYPMSEKDRDESKRGEFQKDFFGFRMEEGKLKRDDSRRFIWSNKGRSPIEPRSGPYPGMDTTVSLIDGLALHHVEGDRYSLDDIVVDLAQLEIAIGIDIGSQYYWAGDPKPSPDATALILPRGDEALREAFIGWVKCAGGMYRMDDEETILKDDMRKGLTRRLTLDQGDNLVFADCAFRRAEDGERVLFSSTPAYAFTERGKTVKTSLLLRPTESIIILFKNKKGELIPDVSLYFDDDYYHRSTVKELSTGRWGVTVTNVLAGDLSFTVYADEYKSKDFVVDPSSPPKPIILEASAPRKPVVPAKRVEIDMSAPEGWNGRGVPVALHWRDVAKAVDFQRKDFSYDLKWWKAASVELWVDVSVKEIEFYLDFADENTRAKYGSKETQLSKTYRLLLVADGETKAEISVLSPLLRPDPPRKRLKISVDGEPLDGFVLYYGVQGSWITQEEKLEKSVAAAILIGERPLTPVEVAEHHVALKSNLKIHFDSLPKDAKSVAVTHQKSRFTQTRQINAKSSLSFGLPPGIVEVCVNDAKGRQVVIDVVDVGIAKVTKWTMPLAIAEFERRNLFRWSDSLDVEFARYPAGPWLGRNRWRHCKLPAGTWFARVYDREGARFAPQRIEAKEGMNVLDLNFDYKSLYSSTLRIKLSDEAKKTSVAQGLGDVNAYVYFKDQEDPSDRGIYRRVAWSKGDILVFGLPANQQMRFEFRLGGSWHDEPTTHCFTTAWTTLDADKETTISADTLHAVDYELEPARIPLEKLGGGRLEEFRHFQKTMLRANGEPLFGAEPHADKDYLWELRAIGSVRQKACPALRIPVVFDEEEYPEASKKLLRDWLARLHKLVYP